MKMITIIYSLIKTILKLNNNIAYLSLQIYLTKIILNNNNVMKYIILFIKERILFHIY